MLASYVLRLHVQELESCIEGLRGAHFDSVHAFAWKVFEHYQSAHWQGVVTDFAAAVTAAGGWHALTDQARIDYLVGLICRHLR